MAIISRGKFLFGDRETKSVPSAANYPSRDELSPARRTTIPLILSVSAYPSPCCISGRIAIKNFKALDRRLPGRPVAYSPIEKN